MKSRILLINPGIGANKAYGKFSEFASCSPPTGLCYIAAYLRKHGYDVSILDAEALQLSIEETMEHVVQASPEFIGLTCKTLWVAEAHELARQIKKAMPGIPIVAGGNHVTALPYRTMEEFPCFDILVIGEGEITFLDLIQAAEKGTRLDRVRGLCIRKKGKPMLTQPRERIKELDQLPMPAYDLLPNLAKYYRPFFSYVEKYPAFPIIVSRGCPMHCAFCDRKVFENRVTKHTPGYTMRLIEYLYRKHGIRNIVFDDDNLLFDRKYLYQLLDLLERSGLEIPFTCQSRVDTVDEERLARLKKAGCTHIMYGIESGSQKILDAMKKGITVEKIKDTIKKTNRMGIKTMGFFILGYPGETEETLKESLALISELKLFDIGAFYFTPLPGSEIYPKVCDYGTFKEDFSKENSLENIVFIPKGTDEKTLKKYMDMFYNSCYARPYQFVLAYKRFSSWEHARLVLKYWTRMLLRRKLV